MILTAVLVLGITGLILAVVLFFISKKFAVEEDPRVVQINEILPGANCGGCGYPGCSAFAENCVKKGSLKGMRCSAASGEVMQQIAEILGDVVEQTTPKVAVVRCNGTCANRPKTSQFNGTKNCLIVSNLYGGETGCS